MSANRAVWLWMLQRWTLQLCPQCTVQQNPVYAVHVKSFIIVLNFTWTKLVIEAIVNDLNNVQKKTLDVCALIGQ